MMKVCYSNVVNKICYLMCNKGPLKTLNGFLKVFIFESTFSVSSVLEADSVGLVYKLKDKNRNKGEKMKTF